MSLRLPLLLMPDWAASLQEDPYDAIHLPTGIYSLKIGGTIS